MALAFGQTAGDFVEQEYARTGGQRTGEFEPLAVDQSEAAGTAVGFLGEPATFEDIHAAVVHVALAVPGAEGGGNDEIFEYAHAGEGQGNLERAANAHNAALRREKPA